MYDYEIRDILNRTKSPIIDLELEIQKYTYEVKQQNFGLPAFTFGTDGMYKKAEPAKEYKTNYTLQIFARNNGRVLANYVNAYIEIPRKYLKEKEEEKGVSSIFMENTIRDIVDSTYIPTMNGGYSSPKYGPSRYDPILPTRCLLLESVKLNDLFIESTDILEWKIYSDNAEPRNGNIRLSEIEIIEK